MLTQISIGLYNLFQKFSKKKQLAYDLKNPLYVIVFKAFYANTAV